MKDREYRDSYTPLTRRKVRSQCVYWNLVQHRIDLERLQGDSPRTPEDEEFLRGLATGIEDWSSADVQLESFTVHAALVPLVVTFDVPGIEFQSGVLILQVGYWHDGPDGRVLKGKWCNQSILDSHVYDTDGPTVIGLAESPRTYGTFAAGWLERQLMRPVERLDWLRGDQIRAAIWRLAESGENLGGAGRWRLLGKPPGRKLRVR